MRLVFAILMLTGCAGVHTEDHVVVNAQNVKIECTVQPTILKGEQ